MSSAKGFFFLTLPLQLCPGCFLILRFTARGYCCSQTLLSSSARCWDRTAAAVNYSARTAMPQSTGRRLAGVPSAHFFSFFFANTSLAAGGTVQILYFSHARRQLSTSPIGEHGGAGGLLSRSSLAKNRARLGRERFIFMLNMCCQMHKDRPKKPRAAITHTANTLGSEQTCLSSSRNTAMHTLPSSHPPTPNLSPHTQQHLQHWRPDRPSPPTWERMKKQVAAVVYRAHRGGGDRPPGQSLGPFRVMQRVRVPAVTYLPSGGGVCVCV